MVQIVYKAPEVTMLLTQLIKKTYVTVCDALEITELFKCIPFLAQVFDCQWCTVN